MKPITLTILAALALAGCHGKGGKSPEETFRAAKEASAKEDWGALFDLFEQSLKNNVEKELDLCRTGPEEVRKATAEDYDIKAEDLATLSAREYFIRKRSNLVAVRPDEVKAFVGAEITELNVEGDLAKLGYRKGDGKAGEMELLRREGRWFISRF